MGWDGGRHAYLKESRACNVPKIHTLLPCGDWVPSKAGAGAPVARYAYHCARCDWAGIRVEVVIGEQGRAVKVGILCWRVFCFVGGRIGYDGWVECACGIRWR